MKRSDYNHSEIPFYFDEDLLIKGVLFPVSRSGAWIQIRNRSPYVCISDLILECWEKSEVH